jgi:hypothetical protein
MKVSLYVELRALIENYSGKNPKTTTAIASNILILISNGNTSDAYPHKNPLEVDRSVWNIFRLAIEQMTRNTMDDEWIKENVHWPELIRLAADLKSFAKPLESQ